MKSKRTGVASFKQMFQEIMFPGQHHKHITFCLDDKIIDGIAYIGHFFEVILVVGIDETSFQLIND